MAEPFLESLPAPTTEEPWPQADAGWTESPADPLDLNMLWHVLERHKEVMNEKEQAGHHFSTAWELVVVQGVILTMLVLIVGMWIVCCRKRCFSSEADAVTVSEALRKLSKDLPPSYSNRDLQSLGISVGDHLHPPPAYLELFNDDLQYLDLEAGHSRMAKLSFCSGQPGSAPRLARLSVASCASCSSDSPVIVPVQREGSRTSLSSASSMSSSSRPASGRNSRVSFSEDVACSNGSTRRLSATPQMVGVVHAASAWSAASRRGSSSSASSGEGSRKSSSSDGSRKSSLISNVRRKFGSHSSVNNESFLSQLDDDLREKLERIGEPDPEPEQSVEQQASESQQVLRSAEEQAERAARICDIIHE